jgi:hypothetical protein
VTGGTHQASVVRRFRHGGYGAWAVCTCGWQIPAANQAHAQRLAGQHNRTPNEQEEAS